METGIFMDKSLPPDDLKLMEALGEQFRAWLDIRAYALAVNPAAAEEWHYSGLKFGWSFRIRDSKRVLIYLLPRDRYFMAAFVFSEKATIKAFESDISMDVKGIIESVRVYAEGRGFRLEIRNATRVNDIKKLVDFKLDRPTGPFP